MTQAHPGPAPTADLDLGLPSLLSRLPPAISDVIEVPLGSREVSADRPLYCVVGASVAACLFDVASGWAGLCHVMLPGQFGRNRDDAMLKADGELEALVNRLLEVMGSESATAQLRAKLFGGAELKRDGLSFSDGQQSVLFARSWLRTRKIPIQNESTAGTKRREIVLIPGTGTVFCKRIAMCSDFLARERDGLLSATAPLNKVELF